MGHWREVRQECPLPLSPWEAVLQLYRWWGTHAACTQGQRGSTVGRQQSRVGSISPQSPSEHASSMEAQHRALKGNLPGRQKRTEDKGLDAKLPLWLNTNKACELDGCLSAAGRARHAGTSLPDKTASRLPAYSYARLDQEELCLPTLPGIG